MNSQMSIPVSPEDTDMESESAGMQCKAQTTAIPSGIARICNAAVRQADQSSVGIFRWNGYIPIRPEDAGFMGRLEKEDARREPQRYPAVSRGFATPQLPFLGEPETGIFRSNGYIPFKTASTVRPTSCSQNGGTLFGMIIGIVLGLAIALAVALYLIKAPNNFVSDKIFMHSPEKEAEEKEHNKTWDPNSALEGKSKQPNPSDSPPATTDNTTPFNDTATTEIYTRTNSVATQPATAASAPSSAKNNQSPKDPLGDFVKTHAADVPQSYFVQIGAYRNEADAQNQLAQLTLSGVDAVLTEHTQQGRPLYRLRAGPFDTQAQAERAKAQLDALGISSSLVRDSSE